MKIEAIITCLNFGDYLKETLPYTLESVDKIIVVTYKEDRLTLDLCRKYKLTKVICHSCLSPVGFDRGLAVNSGIRASSRPNPKTWRLCLDADTIIPFDLKEKVKESIRAIKSRHIIKGHFEQTQFNTIIGANRLLCTSSLQWKKYLETGNHPWVLDKDRSTGNLVPGYFQLWSSVYGALYREGCHTASTTDLVFSKQFPFCSYLSEPVIHLEEGPYELGKRPDHKGRVSRKWGSVV